MAKPIPENPNIRKVTAPPNRTEQEAVRVVVVPPAPQPPIIPATPKAEADSRSGRTILNRMVRLWQSATEGGNNR
jgi:hypothetical protein